MNVATLAALLRERAATPMERFDDPVTDRDVRFAEVQSYLGDRLGHDRFRDHYRVARVGGDLGLSSWPVRAM